MNIIIIYLTFGVIGVAFALLLLPTFLSDRINKKNERKIRELEALLKQKQQIV